jgi:hypothetical protein
MNMIINKAKTTTAAIITKQTELEDEAKRYGKEIADLQKIIDRLGIILLSSRRKRNTK